MSAFHRMVTYLHLYDHDIKGRNIGFAKIEKRNGQCLVEIHMKNTGYSNSPIPVYFYAQKQQSLPGILLGNISLVRGNGDFKAILEEGDLAGSGYGLESVKGIFIPVSEEVMFVSQWDNDPFVRQKFFPLENNPSIDAESNSKDKTSVMATPKTANEPYRPKSSNGAFASENITSPKSITAAESSTSKAITFNEGTVPKIPSIQEKSSTDLEKPFTEQGKSSTDSERTFSEPGKSSTNLERTFSEQGKSSTDLGRIFSEPGKSSTGSEKTFSEPGKSSTDLENNSENTPQQMGFPAQADSPSNTQNQQLPKKGQPSIPKTETASTENMPQNSLKAAEAVPKRSQTVCRNPFALPRFMPLQQNPMLGQRPKSNIAQNAASKNIQRQKNTKTHLTAPDQKQPAPTSAKDTDKKQPAPTSTTGSDKKEPVHTSAKNTNKKQLAHTPEDWPLKWQFLLENYPVMTPFAGDENTLCIRLDLKDLRLLPQKYWNLGNNSFLLHGFFNYRYLILGMTEKSEQKKWFIGIPGVFQNPERVMATLFGFPGFRNEKSVPINTGEFGYWYRFLDE